jgi:5-methylthioadenosine/S-adenosylhomocysteine deaminase
VGANHVNEGAVSTFALIGATAITISDPAVVHDATIVVEDGRIASISSHGTAPARTVDARGALILPGFVNAHSHTLESFLRGCGGQLTLLPWIRITHAVMDQLDSQGAALATRLATMEMLLSGTTAYLDPEIPSDHRFDAMATAAAASGLRAGLTMLLEDRGGYHEWSTRAAPELTDEERHLIERWHGAADGRVAVWVGPSVLSAVTPEFGTAIGLAADQHGLGIALHCAEVPEDRVDTMERMGVGPVAFADAAHLLGRRTAITHGVDLHDDELSLLAQRGTSLVHCPSSNAKLGSGIAPIPAALAAGVNVALGTDGGSSNDSYDMFSEIRLAGLLHRAAARDPGAMSVETVLRMATANGARALGLSGGRLAEGEPADLVLLDASTPGFAPTANEIDSLAFAGSRQMVRDVFVGGEPLLRDRRPIDVDVSTLIRDAGEAARAAIDAAGVRDQVTSAWWEAAG